jgi:hypothetical protein
MKLKSTKKNQSINAQNPRKSNRESPGEASTKLPRDGFKELRIAVPDQIHNELQTIGEKEGKGERVIAYRMIIDGVKGKIDGIETKERKKPSIKNPQSLEALGTAISQLHLSINQISKALESIEPEINSEWALSGPEGQFDKITRNSLSLYLQFIELRFNTWELEKMLQVETHYPSPEFNDHSDWLVNAKHGISRSL